MQRADALDRWRPTKTVGDHSHTVALRIIGQQIQGLRRGSNHRAAPLMKGLLLKTNNSTYLAVCPKRQGLTARDRDPAEQTARRRINCFGGPTPQSRQ